MDKPHNKKSPEGPQQSKRAKPEYPWVSGHSDVNGRHKLIHADPSNPDTSFVEEFNHDGSFLIHETLKDEKGLKNELYHHHRQYGISKSSHHDGNHDIRAYNKSVVVDKDLGHQVGGNYHKGVQGQEVKSVKESTKTRQGGKGSKQNSFHSTNGDGSHLYEGNYFTFYGKDHGHAVDGSYYGMFSGEHGQYVQGNFDTHSDKKLKMSSGQDLMIQSDSKITLKVGQSSIVISDGSITIKSGSIKFEKSDG